MSERRRMTTDERLSATEASVTEALAAFRQGDRAEVNRLLVHAVHLGMTPAELVAEIVAQTGGRL